MNLVYYGLILNMNTFGGNVYLNSVSEYVFSTFYNIDVNTSHRYQFSFLGQGNVDVNTYLIWYTNISPSQLQL